MTKQLYTGAELSEMLEAIRTTAVAHCRLLRPLAGGQPADDAGLRGFVEHHLGIPPETLEFTAALERIKREEIGERDTTPETGELETLEVYQVNVVRRSAKGPYILEHMVKAMLKQSASRLGLFMAQKKRGSKGDLAEFGTVTASGESLQDSARPWEIYPRIDGGPASTSYVKISGSVNTPQGKKSIQHHTEVIAEGSEFWFELRWPATRLNPDDIARIIAGGAIIGLGSCLSLGYGAFRVETLEISAR